MSRIGVVTVTYNSASVIDGFMASIASQAFREFKTYVVDNASSDNGLSRVRADALADDRIVLIVNHENRGVAVGNNQGIAAAIADGCDRVLLINNDVEFGPDLLSELAKSMDRVGADMLVPKIRYFSPADMIWCAGGKFNRSRAFSTVHFGEGITDRGQFDTARRIEYAPTCCMMIRCSVFDRIGVMDENFFVYYDDTDFCYRALLAGIPFWYTPTPILYHKVSSLTGGMSNFTILNATRGKVYFIRKHFRRFASLWIAVYRILFFFRIFDRSYGVARYKILNTALNEAMAQKIPGTF